MGVRARIRESWVPRALRRERIQQRVRAEIGGKAHQYPTNRPRPRHPPKCRRPFKSPALRERTPAGLAIPYAYFEISSVASDVPEIGHADIAPVDKNPTV